MDLEFCLHTVIVRSGAVRKEEFSYTLSTEIASDFPGAKLSLDIFRSSSKVVAHDTSWAFERVTLIGP